MATENNEETQRLLTNDMDSMELRPRSGQGQNNDVEAGINIEENQGNQQSQEVRIRFWPVKNKISISTLTLHTM